MMQSKRQDISVESNTLNHDSQLYDQLWEQPKRSKHTPFNAMNIGKGVRFGNTEESQTVDEAIALKQIDDLELETKDERYKTYLEEVRGHSHSLFTSIDEIGERNRETATRLGTTLGEELAFMLFSKDWQSRCQGLYDLKEGLASFEFVASE